ALANDLGVPESIVLENGTTLDVHKDLPLSVGEPFLASSVRIAPGGQVISSQVRRRRGEMARRGVIFVSIVLDEDGRTLAPPRVSTRGVAGIDDDEGALSVLESAVRRSLEDAPRSTMVKVEQSVVRALKTAAEEMCATKPLIEVHLTQPRV